MMRVVTATTALKRFEILDSWRGICALMIVLYHAPQFFVFSNSAVIRSSWLVVDFFFVLSGFVTTHAYGTEIANVGHVLHFVVNDFAKSIRFIFLPLLSLCSRFTAQFSSINEFYAVS